MKKPKVCFLCSSGGHYSEMTNLYAVAKKYDSFLVTEKVEKLSGDMCNRNYFVKMINRKEKFFLFKFLFLCIKDFFIFIKERPTHVISVGALSTYPMLKIAKFFRKKIIYVESYARITDLSYVGKKAYKFADLFIVQWKELTEKYPKAKYIGSFFGGEI